MNKELIKKEIKEVEARIKESEDKLKELREKLECKGRWVPKIDERYYFIDECGDIVDTEHREHEIDIWNIKTRNCFKTEKECKLKKEVIEIECELMDLAEELNGGVEIDWDNIDQAKFHLLYDFDEQEISKMTNRNWKGKNIYCLDEDFDKKAIEKIGEERLIKYLKY